MVRDTQENYNKRAREFAVYRGVWSLSKEERTTLDHIYIAATNVRDFLENLSDEHSHKDFIVVCGYKYEVAYMDCGSDMMEELSPNTPLLISFRYRHRPNISIAVVMLADKIADLSCYKHLNADFSKSSLVSTR